MFWFSWPLFFLLRLPSLFEPYWYGDEGVYLSLGQGINHGLTLFSQIHDNKPPLLYYFAALPSNLPAGWQIFGFRFLLLLWMIPTVYVFYLLSQKFLSKSLSRISVLVFILLSSIPLIEGNIANAEIFMLLPTLAAFLIFPSRIFLSGLLLGLALTFKIPVAVEFFFLFCWLIFIIDKFNLTKNFKLKFKNYIVFVFAFFLPILLFYLYFVLRGAGSQFLFAALLQNFGYLGSWTTGSQSASAASGGLIWRLGLIFLSWILLFFLYRKKRLDKKLFFLSAWFIATLFGALLSARPYPHYLIQLLPPLLILLFSLRRNFYLSVFLLVLLVASILKYKFYFYSTLPYYQNFINYVLKLKSTFQYRQYFGVNVNNIYELSTLIKSKTDPENTIFIWGDEPYLYPLTDRLPASKYVVAYHIVDFNDHDLVLRQLTINQPRAIVYNSAMANRSFLKLDQFISNYYYLDNQIGPYYLFLSRQ